MKIGIITAMQVEHDQIAALLTDCAELPAPSFGAPPVLTGRLGNHTVVLAMSKGCRLASMPTHVCWLWRVTWPTIPPSRRPCAAD